MPTATQHTANIAQSIVIITTSRLTLWGGGGDELADKIPMPELAQDLCRHPSVVPCDARGAFLTCFRYKPQWRQNEKISRPTVTPFMIESYYASLVMDEVGP